MKVPGNKYGNKRGNSYYYHRRYYFLSIEKNLFEHVVFYVMCSFGDFSICLAFLFFPYLFNFTLNIFSRRVYGNEPYS